MLDRLRDMLESVDERTPDWVLWVALIVVIVGLLGLVVWAAGAS